MNLRIQEIDSKSDIPLNVSLMTKLSIIIPVYNEIDTLQALIARVQSVELLLDKEIVLVDDASTDGTRELIQNRPEEAGVVKIFHRIN